MEDMRHPVRQTSEYHITREVKKHMCCESGTDLVGGKGGGGEGRQHENDDDDIPPGLGNPPVTTAGLAHR